ncbi:hypothetical protein H6G97_18950 [Nostoc flagelliforme FACHB-838]|uniref:Uncharacterized protein n=1 Tax=Nostoc flagelliforme FACHB-838 TaxID=2692904 RepID=A0ABR8DRW3_9NOSO|nr:hypothetical protein [Nostoc flagelliforme]MBD2531552.1 hypothetical protein [Nostoc flagelliforme FACHB-838]
MYEKSQEFRLIGTGLELAPNGLNFLDAMPTAGCANAPGIVETLKSLGHEVHHTVLKNIQGETIRANATKYLEQYGQPLLTIWWYRLK